MYVSENRGDIEYDAVIAGSGPGGATVARELAGKGKKVLILEWGDFDPVRGKVVETVKRALLPGKGLLLTPQLVGMIRAITTGGSSLLYCATAFDPPEHLFSSHGVDVSAQLAEIKNEIPMAPLEDRLMGPGPRRFFESAAELGYDVKKLNKFIYQDRCKPSCQLCSYGCPYLAKWNARNFVEEALSAGASIINHAKVTRVIYEGKTAVGLSYKKDGMERSVYAKKVILAAGGIGTPLILRKSRIKAAGHDFFFDPLIFVFGKVPGINEGRAVPMSTGVHFADDGIVMTDFNMPRILKLMFDLEVFKFTRAFYFSNVIPVMIKIRDDLGGELTDRGGIRKPLSREDKLRLEKGAMHAERILKKAGATDVYKSWVFAAHPGGTVKMGELVDENLKTRYENLYVCDCSVMPQEWGLPPTLSILVLAKRLAAHLLAADSAGGKNSGEKRKPGKDTDKIRAAATA